MHIFSILYCILFTYCFTYFAYVTYLAYFFIHIFCIFVNVVANLHILLHIYLRILWHIYWHIMHILHILHILYICAWWHMLQVFVLYFLNFQKNENDRIAKTDSHPTTKWSNHSISHITCASRGVWTLVVSTESLSPYQTGYKSLRESSFHHCVVQQLRAQLFTYHHLQPSLLSFVLLQEAPGMSAASLRISYGIVPVLPTGTRGSLPSMEDTGITYRTCADSRLSYTMVDWHASILFILQLIVVRKLEAFQNHMLELE